MGQTITVRLPKDLADWLERTSAGTGRSQGAIIREQLQRARSGVDARAYLRLAGTVRGARKLSSRKGFSRP